MKWLGASQAAAALGLHINTLKKISPSRLPYYRMTERGDRRYRAADVEAYLAARRVDVEASR